MCTYGPRRQAQSNHAVAAATARAQRAITTYLTVKGRVRDGSQATSATGNAAEDAAPGKVAQNLSGREHCDGSANCGGGERVSRYSR